MPEISRFFGVIIRMYYDDHEPPHFHAIYGGDEAQIGIDPIKLELAASGALNGLGVGGITSSRTEGKLEAFARQPDSQQDRTIEVR